MLSKNKDTDFIILMELNDKELAQICRSNKYINSLCNDDTFWRNRTVLRFHLSSPCALLAEKMKNYLQWKTWKEYYIWLRSIVAYKYHKKIKTNDFLFESSDKSSNIYITKFYLDNLLLNTDKIELMERKIKEVELKSLPKWLGSTFIIQLRRRLYKDIFVHTISGEEENNYFNKATNNIINELKELFDYVH
jgi:hypothetical protein